MIAIGSIFQNSCSLNYLIPIWLIVDGVAIIVFCVSFLIFEKLDRYSLNISNYLSKYNHLFIIKREFERDDVRYKSNFWAIITFITFLFLIIWFFIGKKKV